MHYYFKRAVSDICSNRFLTVITIITIALSILVVSSFVLFFENSGRIMDSWTQGIRIMAYLDTGFKPDMLPELTKTIQEMAHTQDVIFISKADALKQLKADLKAGGVFLEGLKGNPLPDAVEIHLKRGTRQMEEIKAYADAVKDNPLVLDVEYGQRWMGQFLHVFNLFRITGFTLAVLFLLIALFITANTIRLALYSRREEVEIMRLVGATDRFIIMPFHIEGLLQGAVGGILGIGILLVAYGVIASGMEGRFPLTLSFNIRFISLHYSMLIILFSTVLGWLGCYLSLRNFLKF